ncbi:MAG: PAS domain S-box protein, partial [Ignavibacteriaceae bacterium]|nr:PAS domain S-box protein [Ignavibacteriaceae bacterium]
PSIKDDDFDWIKYYGEITLTGGKNRFIQYSKPLSKHYDVEVFSPGEMLFVTIFSDHSETIKSEMEILELRQKFDSLFTQLVFGVALVNKKSHEILSYNTQFGKLLNFSGNKEEKSKFYEFISETEKSELTTFLESTRDENVKLLHFEINNTSISDSPEFVKITISPILGEIDFYFVIAEDISEIKKQQLLLIESETQFRKIFEVAKVGILQYSPVTGKILSCNNELCEITGYSYKELLNLNYIDLIHPNERGEDSLRIITLFDTEKKFNDTQKYVKKDGSEIWVRVDISFIQDLNGSVEKAVVVCQDITKEKIFSEHILEEEERFRILLNSIPMLIYAFDENGKIIYWNKMAEKVTGYSEEYMIGTKNSFELLFTKDQYKNFKNSTSKINHISNEVEITTKSGKGKKIVCHDLYKLVSIPGWDSWSVAEDVTEKRITQSQLEKTEKLFKALIEKAPMGVVMIDAEENFIYVSPTAKKMFEYDDFESPHIKPSELTHPDDLPIVQKTLMEIMSEPGKSAVLQYRFLNKSGIYKWIESTFTNLLSEPAVNGIVINFADIQDRKDAEKIISENEERLRLSLAAASQGLFDLDIKTGEAIVNDQYARMLGFDPLTFKETNSFWVERLHPEDRDRVFQAYKDYIEGKTQEYSVEFRNRTANNSWKWILSSGSIVEWDKDGNPTRMLGTHIEITKQKRSEFIKRIQLNIANSVITSNSIEELYQTIKNELSTLLDTKNLYMANFDKNTGLLSTVINVDEKDEITEWPADISLSGKVVLTGKSLLVNGDEIEEMRSRGEIEFFGSRAEIWLGVPFFIKNEVAGLIAVQSYEDKNAFTQEDVEILEIIAVELSIYLEKKSKEAELVKLFLAISQSPTTVQIIDNKGIIEYVNPAFEESSGYCPEEVIGKNIQELRTGFDDDQLYGELWSTVYKGNVWRGELKNRKKNGEIYWEDVSISPVFNYKDEITNFVIVKEDITEIKEMINELKAAKEKAEEINRVKSNFFANMSHELRTPLIGILGYSEILEEYLEDRSDLIKMVRTINKSGNRLLETLNLILTFSKLESDKFEVKIKTVDIIPVINETFDLFINVAAKKELQYVFNTSQQEIFAEIDTGFLQSILNNLINNAIKFTYSGYVKVSASVNDKTLIIRVEDSGIGISDDDQVNIWEDFRQASEGLSRRFEGTGLGLAIVKRYTNLMGGEISVESEEGKGSTFTLKFPVTKKNETESIEKSEDVLSEETPVLKSKPNILYVEDDEVALNLVQKFLESDFIIDSAINSQEALSKVNLISYDGILMDINLKKGLSGVELTKIIRELPGYSEIPIIAITSFAFEKDRIEFLNSGMDHYIAKPFRKIDLVNLMHQIFSGFDE